MQKEITQALHKILREIFGFQAFRSGQLEALTALMVHGRLLCIQPTGHGKSLLYQLSSILLGGVTLVVSPLLALMRDQLIQLKNRFGIAAASFNTDQTEEENAEAIRAVKAGEIRILFIAPEQLDHVDRFDFLLKLPLTLIVVDEAHCISTWGHDFRPSYRQIVKLVYAVVKKNPAVKILGLTATANEKTEGDIRQQLTVDQQAVIIHRESMDRPNIRLSVITSIGTAAKLVTLLKLLKTCEGSGLIYCATRENTELTAEYLSWQGIKTVAYHAGLAVDQKRYIQNEFMQDKYPVITATNALGMGIDKANLRFIIHFDFPGSLTAYYQEVGRCGRDGLPADGILLYDPADYKVQRYFIESAQPNLVDFQAVLETVAHAESLLNLTALKRATGLHPTRLTVVVAELAEQGFLKKSSVRGVQVYCITNKSGVPDLVRYKTQWQVRNADLEAMQSYAEKRLGHCLMRVLRDALGDKQAHACGKCSQCVGMPFDIQQDEQRVANATAWLSQRNIPLTLSKRMKQVVEGASVLDGKLRTSDFIQFMKGRADNNAIQFGLSDHLMVLIKNRITSLAKRYQPRCIVPIPSRTWVAREAVARLLADYLGIPVILDLLCWGKLPPNRQGELLNNDQRRHNVSGHLLAAHQKIPAGSLLLFDDYVGSGATLDEAARALRARGIYNEIVPFTIAAVKWRLGKRGMV